MINLSALKANVDFEIEASKKESNEAFRCTMGLAELISEALEQEIASDKVEVVRCKDCKHHDTEECKMSFYDDTGESFSMCDLNDFCSYGERRAEK